jgi:hypothetical protein
MTTAAMMAGRHGRLIAGLLAKPPRRAYQLRERQRRSHEPESSIGNDPGSASADCPGCESFPAHSGIDAKTAKIVGGIVEPFPPADVSSYWRVPPASIFEMVKIVAGAIMDFVVTSVISGVSP